MFVLPHKWTAPIHVCAATQMDSTNTALTGKSRQTFLSNTLLQISAELIQYYIYVKNRYQIRDQHFIEIHPNIPSSMMMMMKQVSVPKINPQIQ
jgi:hypothetical protein